MFDALNEFEVKSAGVPQYIYLDFMLRLFARGLTINTYDAYSNLLIFHRMVIILFRSRDLLAMYTNKS